MKYQYDDSIIKIIVGDKDNYITEQTEFQVMREKSEFRIAYKNNLALIREQEIDELLNDIISKKPLRTLAKKYGRDFMKNYKAYKDYASAVALEETTNSALARSIIDNNRYNDYYDDEQELAQNEIEDLYNER